ncbi:MAG: adenylate/guanylate cyclase domain-containing protein [Acidimicrobiia bacterium]
MAGPVSGTFAFLFTDIEGSTSLWEIHPREMADALARHDQLLGEVVVMHNGRVFKHTGDGFAAAFSSAADAVAAALAGQVAIESEPWPFPSGIHVRMGLHAGSAEERGGDYFGPTLNQTARVMGAAHGGQTLVSSSARDLAAGTLPDRSRLDEAGSVHLRGLSGLHTLYQLVHPDLKAGFPPLNADQVGAGNLPGYSSAFIGRRSELDEVTALVADNRLVTILGPGGAGKTRLAIETAARAEQFTHGTWIVELGPLRDSSLVDQALAAALNVDQHAALDLRQSLVATIRDHRLLLVLDNCEHLIDACADTAGFLLDTCRHVQILATSRQPLRVEGETTWPIPALATPPATPSSKTDEPIAYDSVALFVERAASVRHGFILTPDNEEAIGSICRRLDGIPLAIELAGARSDVLTPEQIDARLGDRFALLTGGSRTADPRQQTLQATLDWGFNLLDAPEQALLRRLAVFRGDFSLEAAEEVCPGDPIEPAQILDLVSQLTRKSMVEAESRPGGMRYRLLETVREYSAARLEEAGEHADYIQNHQNWFVRLAEQASSKLRSSDQLEWLARLEADHDNLRAVLERTVMEGTPEPALRIARSIWPFWWLHSHFEEGDAWLKTALAQADVDPQLRVGVLIGAAQFAWEHGENDSATARLDEALHTAREIGSRTHEAWALGYRALLATFDEDYALSRQLAGQAMEAFSDRGNFTGVGFAQWIEAGATLAENRRPGDLSQGELERLYAVCDNLLASSRVVGDRNMIGHLHESLGAIQRVMGQVDESRPSVAAAVRALFELGNKGCTAHALDQAAAVELAQGRTDVAARLLGATGAMRDRLGGHSLELRLWGEYAAEAREVLGSRSADSLLSEGRRWDLDEAVARVLDG